jgi:hypothetical protein
VTYSDKLSASVQEKDILKYGGRIVGKGIRPTLNAKQNASDLESPLLLIQSF